ncbi:helix-turn-helix domain-containing protein [Spirillospora sp. NPDC047418]
MESRSRRRAPGMSPRQRREMIVRTALPLVAEHGTAVTTGQIARAAGIGEATIFRVFADKDELLDACVAEALRPDHVLAEIEAIPLDQPLPARLTEASAAIEAYLARMGLVIGALHATGRPGRPLPAPGAPRGGAPSPDPGRGGPTGDPDRDEPTGDLGGGGPSGDPGGGGSSGDLGGGGPGGDPGGGGSSGDLGGGGPGGDPGGGGSSGDLGGGGPGGDPGGGGSAGARPERGARAGDGPGGGGAGGDVGREAAMSRTRDAIAELFEPERDRLRLPPEQTASLFMGLAFTRARPPAGPAPSSPSMQEYLEVFLHGALKEGTAE